MSMLAAMNKLRKLFVFMMFGLVSKKMQIQVKALRKVMEICKARLTKTLYLIDIEF